MKTVTKLWIGIGILILLSPLGLWLPEHFRATDAWGEWGADSFKELVGYVPRGLDKFSDFWNAPFCDYTFHGWEEKGLPYLSVAYIFSALLGIAVIFVVVMLIAKLFKKDNR